jgi:hypothetical protein
VNDQRGRRDPELEDLFDAPQDREVAGEVRQFLRSVQQPPHDPDPAFQSALRRRLLEDAWRRQQAPPPWYRRLLGPRPLAAAGALAAALVIALVVATFRPGEQGVQVTSPLQGAHTVSVVQPITLSFNQPMDQRSTQAAVAIEPATPVAYRWTSPQTLELVPQGGSLAPATQYQVTVAPTARTAEGRPLAQETRIAFVTGPPATTTPTEQPSTGATPAPSPSAAPTPSPGASPTPEPSAAPSPSEAPSVPASPPASQPGGPSGSSGSPGSAVSSPPPAKPPSG